MAIAPNLDGFVGRQNDLRSAMGSLVIFKVPVTATWPGGTKINPDTGLPYDATIQPTSARFREVPKTCLIIEKMGSPLRPQPDAQTSPVGEMSEMDVILDVAEGDYPDVENATGFTAQGLDYRVRQYKPFSIAGRIYRHLIYGQAR